MNEKPVVKKKFTSKEENEKRLAEARKRIKAKIKADKEAEKARKAQEKQAIKEGKTPEEGVSLDTAQDRKEKFLVDLGEDLVLVNPEKPAPATNSVATKALNQIASRDIPDLYEGLDIDFDKLGCIMINTEKIPVIQYVPELEDQIYTDGDHTGVAGEKEPHVTLLFGLLENGNVWKDKVDAVLKDWELPMVTIEEVSFFDLGESYAIIGLVEKTPELIDGHERLTLLPHINTFSEYHPHITLAYINHDADPKEWVKALGKKYNGQKVATKGINYGDLPEKKEDKKENHVEREQNIPETRAYYMKIVDNKYELYDRSGDLVDTYDTQAEAETRLRSIVKKAKEDNHIEDEHDMSNLKKVVPKKKDNDCKCCNGAGEHKTGFECYGCDASGLQSDFEGTFPCDGREDSENVVEVKPGIYEHKNAVEHSHSHDSYEHESVHNSTLEKAQNALEPARRDIVMMEESKLYLAAQSIENDMSAKVLEALRDGDIDKARDIISTEEEKRFVNSFETVLKAYFLVLYPIYAQQLMQARANQYNMQGVYSTTKQVEREINQQATKAAKSHVDTVRKDLISTLNDAYDEATSIALIGLVRQKVEARDESFTKLLPDNPNIEDIEDAVKSGKFNGHPAYKTARELARQGEGLDAMTRAIQKEYENMTKTRAKTIARHETNRVFNMAQYQADIQFLTESGLMENAYKILRNRANDPCPICNKLIEESRANPIPFTKNFADLGTTISAQYTSDRTGKVLTMNQPINYESIKAGNVHVNCRCEYELVIKQEDGTFLNELDFRVINAGKGNPYRAKDGKFTTGGTKKGMSPEDAAKGTNPNYQKGETAYSENCQKCVPTYELRRRGIDVEALPFDENAYMVSHNLGQQKLWGAKEMDYNWHEIKMVNGMPKTITKSKSDFVKALRSFPEGARVQMNYSHGRKRIGHTIMVEFVKKSKKFPHGMMFVDPQVNTITGGINLKDKSRMSLIRLDNKTMNPDMAGVVAKEV